MSQITRQLLTLEPDVRQRFADGLKDYRGQRITPAHVLRYLHTDLYRIEEITRLVVKHSAPSEAVLDVGICYGFYDILLKRDFGRDVRALELEENFPAYRGLWSLGDVEVVAGELSAEGLPLESGSHDVVILSEVLEHLRIGPLLGLLEVWRVLAPGGRLVLTTPNVARLSNVARLLAGRNILEPLPDDGSEWPHITDAVAHIREYTMREVVELVQRAGFSVVERRFSHAWDRYNPHLLKTASLPARLAHALLSFLTWLLPPLRSGLVVVARKR